MEKIVAVSGAAPIGPYKKTVHPGDVYSQIQACLRLSSKAREELGATTADVIKTRIMLTDIALCEEASNARVEISQR